MPYLNEVPYRRKTELKEKGQNIFPEIRRHTMDRNADRDLLRHGETASRRVSEASGGTFYVSASGRQGLSFIDLPVDVRPPSHSGCWLGTTAPSPAGNFSRIAGSRSSRPFSRLPRLKWVA